MADPVLVLRLPDGRSVELGPEALIGRGSRADVVLADPRVSTVHAEVSWRDGGFCVLARGGRVVVDGVAVSEAPLREGSRLTLAPGVTLEVERVCDGDVPVVPKTASDERLVVRGDQNRVELRWGAAVDPRLVLEGLPARLLFELAGAAEPIAWCDAAAVLWPDEAEQRATRGPLRSTRWTPIDERRYRNRLDQVLASLRSQLATVRSTPMIQLKAGAIQVVWDPRDEVRLG